MMAKKVFIVGVLVLALGLIILTKIPAKQKNQGVELKSRGGYEALVEEYPEILGCRELQDPYMEGDCLRQKAVEFNDVRLCGIQSTLLGKSECIRALALENKESSLCSKIANTTYRNGCYYSLAITMNDPVSCSKIQSNSSRSRCIAKTTKNAIVCDELENDVGRDWCIKGLAIKTLTPELCARIQTISFRDSCYLESVKKLPLTSSYCRKIVDEELRGKCWGVGVRIECPLDKINTNFLVPL